MKKILNKRNGIMVIAGIVLIVAAAIYVITRPVTLDLKDYLQYEWLDLKKIDEYPLLPGAVKNILKENKFPIHKINNDLK